MPKATIPIYHDDDFERMAELRMEVSIAERRVKAAREDAEESVGSNRREGDDEPDAVQEAKDALHAAQEVFNAFVDEAEPRAEMWVLKPIGHEDFRDLLVAHPPRKVKVKVKAPTEDDPDREIEREETHPADGEPFNVNTETFPKALLLFIDPDDDEHRTIVGPKFDTEAAFRKRVKRLSKGQFESMWMTAFMANEGGAADPKLARF